MTYGPYSQLLRSSSSFQSPSTSLPPSLDSIKSHWFGDYLQLITVDLVSFSFIPTLDCLLLVQVLPS